MPWQQRDQKQERRRRRQPKHGRSLKTILELIIHRAQKIQEKSTRK